MKYLWIAIKGLWTGLCLGGLLIVSAMFLFFFFFYMVINGDVKLGK